MPALLLAALQGPEMIAYVVGLYLLVHLLEGYLLMPLVQEYAVSLPPALTLSATVMGGVLFGVIGIFVATPVVAVVLVLVKMLYLEDALGDHVALPHRLGAEASAPSDSRSPPTEGAPVPFATNATQNEPEAR